MPTPAPPLAALTTLVTRPGEQNAALCKRIASLGGATIALPVIVIEPLLCEPLTDRFDLVIFVSAHAVRYGLEQAQTSRIAAIGPATATALAAAERPANMIAPPPHTSESLLSLPEFAHTAGQRILIVRGAGGRELLSEELLARGAHVRCANVYRRTAAHHAPRDIAALEERWTRGEVNIVTLTSVDILDHLLALLSERGRRLLQQTPFVAISERIERAARAKGLVGECVRAAAADDEAIVNALMHWHAQPPS